MSNATWSSTITFLTPSRRPAESSEPPASEQRPRRRSAAAAALELLGGATTAVLSTAGRCAPTRLCEHGDAVDAVQRRARAFCADSRLSNSTNPKPRRAASKGHRRIVPCVGRSAPGTSSIEASSATGSTYTVRAASPSRRPQRRVARAVFWCRPRSSSSIELDARAAVRATLGNICLGAFFRWLSISSTRQLVENRARP